MAYQPRPVMAPNGHTDSGVKLESAIHGHEDPSACDLARMVTSRALMADDPYAELGNWVFETRKSHGWRQQTLANMLGLSRASVANLETGRQRILFHTFLQLCNVLSKPVSGDADAADWLAKENRELRAQIAMLKAQKARKRPPSTTDPDRAPGTNKNQASGSNQ